MENSMTYYVVKVLISATLIVLISEIAKRNLLVGAIIASVPLVSVLAIIWLYIDTKNIEKIGVFASNIFWLVLPSLALFPALVLLLKQGLNFYLSISIAIVLTVGCYYLTISVLNYFEVRS